MPNLDSLSTLKDIHLPPPVGWWPPAPGWYILFSISLLLGAGLLGFLYQRHCQARAKKEALALLKKYQTQYNNTHNASLVSANINALLKRVALVYYPRHNVASLQEDAWLNFLNQTSQGINFKEISDLLLKVPYEAHASVSLDPLFQYAKKWIEQRRRPCLN